MASWVCLTCSTTYSVDAPACPHCGSAVYAEEGTEQADMAKITVHGGASNAAAVEEEGSAMSEVEESAEAVEETAVEEAEAVAEGDGGEEPAADDAAEGAAAAEESADADADADAMEGGEG